jgi:hypothetical protein
MPGWESPKSYVESPMSAEEVQGPKSNVQSQKQDSETDIRRWTLDLGTGFRWTLDIGL